MKKRNYIKERYKQLSEDAKKLLSAKGARISLIASLIFVTAAAGFGMITSYLLLNILDYLKVAVSDAIAYAVMAGMIFLFLPPAIGGMRSIASAVCDGREVSLSEIFIAFSSAERIMSAYLGAFFSCLRYGIAVALFLIPDIVEIVFKLENEDGTIAPILFPIAAASVALAVLWPVFTRRLSRLSYFIWSQKMNAFRALGASVSRKHIARPVFGEDCLALLLSAATCFTYFIYQAAPLFALKYELYFRREGEYVNQFVKSRKDGQK